MARKHIAVIGGGIIGSAIACELTAADAQVTLVDSGDPSSNATRCSFGWINAHNHNNRHHFRLRLKSMARWRELADQFPALPVRFCPALDWDMPAESMETVTRAYNDMGYHSEIFEASEVRRQFPALQGFEGSAILCSGDAVATPEEIAGFFMETAKQQGADVRAGCTLTGIDTLSNRVSGISINDEKIACDAVVVAAGCASPKLLEPLGIDLPMDNRSGLLVRTNPLPQLVDAIISAPGVHFWQMQDGRLLAGKNRAGEHEAQNLQEFSQSLLETITSLAPKAGHAKVENHTLGTRPQPADGMPVLGRSQPFENLHLAVMHSGITLAPEIARQTAREILSETDCEDFILYKLNRFDQAQRSLAS